LIICGCKSYYQLRNKSAFFMIKIIALTTLLIFALSYTASSQIDIYLKEYKTYITPAKCKDSLIHYNKDSSYVKIDLFNCKGKMSIKELDRHGTLVATGQYQASLDTLKQYVDRFNLSGDLMDVTVGRYFQPLRDGVWIFYENGLPARQERYKRGVLIKD